MARCSAVAFLLAVAACDGAEPPVNAPAPPKPTTAGRRPSVEKAEALARPDEAIGPPPEITSESEEGFHDLVFRIEEHRKLPDGAQVLRVMGTHKGERVGLEVLLAPAWKRGTLRADVPLVTWRGRVAYRSIGPESDLLIRILDELYGTRQSPKAMARETLFAGISLEGEPNDLGQGTVKIKLFFESDAEGRYAELFTNIEPKAMKLYVREKDPEYRRAIIRCLQSP